MRILLDECLPKQLRKYLKGHEAWTVRQMRWNGKRNGELLRLMAAKGFEVLLTTDRNIPLQQNLRKAGVAMVILSGVRQDVNALATLLPEVFLRLQVIQPGDVVEVWPSSNATAKPVLALVGGIGAGKSAAADALASRGGRVVAADPAGHAALLDPANRARVAARWPAAAAADGSIDRKALGRIVFGDPVALKELEAIVFPWIAERLKTEIAAAKTDPAVRFVVLDAAVLLEADMKGLCDRLIFIDAPRDVRAARVASRGWSPDELDRRERSQWSLDRKRSAASAVLVNDGTPAELQANADALLASWGLIPHG